MPRPKSPPKYQLHKARGQAITRIDGRTIYLGKYDTPASHQKFAQVLSEWQLTGTAVAKDQLPVKNLLLAYLKHASEYYRKGGEQTSEYRCLLYDDVAGTDARFWKLDQSLSALYLSGTDEKRWIDGVLARKKGLGL